MQTRFFQFEADFVDSLRCIPMQVRLKLDNCGIKLKLPQWHQFSDEERQALVDLPCETETEVQTYRQLLKHLISERTGEAATELAIDPHPAWDDVETVASSVQAKATEHDVTITPAQWSNLSPEQRFALIKLSRSNHENANFLPALHEFQII
jgi:hypothetical protein